MKSIAIRLAIAGGLILVATQATTRGAAQTADQPTARTFTGSGLFTSYCATCHGAGGVGDGPVAPMLRKRPANLTILARNNGGVFSRELVSRMIDGRKPVSGHGGGDMPVWGEAFTKTSDNPDAAPIKIAALVDYIESIQQKPLP